MCFALQSQPLFNLQNVLESLNVLSPHNTFKLPSKSSSQLFGLRRQWRVTLRWKWVATQPNNTKKPGGRRVQKGLQPQFHGTGKLQVPGWEHDALTRRRRGRGVDRLHGPAGKVISRPPPHLLPSIHFRKLWGCGWMYERRPFVGWDGFNLLTIWGRRTMGWRGEWPTQTRIKVQILQQKNNKT